MLYYTRAFIPLWTSRLWWGQGVSAARAAVLSCAAAPPAPTVVYVAKMLAVPASSLPRGAARDAGPGPSGDPNPVGEVFLAFGRVFAGTLRDGDRVHVLSAAYDPAEPERHRQEAQVSHIHMYSAAGRPLACCCSVQDCPV